MKKKSTTESPFPIKPQVQNTQINSPHIIKIPRKRLLLKENIQIQLPVLEIGKEEEFIKNSQLYLNYQTYPSNDKIKNFVRSLIFCCNNSVNSTNEHLIVLNESIFKFYQEFNPYVPILINFLIVKFSNYKLQSLLHNIFMTIADQCDFITIISSCIIQNVHFIIFKVILRTLTRNDNEQENLITNKFAIQKILEFIFDYINQKLFDEVQEFVILSLFNYILSHHSQEL
jgi:hypothetical protein